MRLSKSVIENVAKREGLPEDRVQAIADKAHGADEFWLMIEEEEARN